MSSVPPVLAVCLGACVGAVLRWRLGLWLNTVHSSGVALPWGTLAANWLGAYAVGLVLALLQRHPDWDPAWRLFAVTGLLGALTTFSTFSAEVVAYLQAGRWHWALGSAALHLLGSLLLTWAGLKTLSFL